MVGGLRDGLCVVDSGEFVRMGVKYGISGCVYITGVEDLRQRPHNRHQKTFDRNQSIFQGFL